MNCHISKPASSSQPTVWFLPSTGPPGVLLARNLGSGRPQQPSSGPHGPGSAADRDLSPDVHADGDRAEPRDRTLQSAGRRQGRCHR